LKNRLFAILFIAFLVSCKNHDPEKIADDTLMYIPLSPGLLSKNELKYYKDTLTAYFDSILLKRGFNGSILVAKKGNVLYEKYFGKRDLRKAEPVTDSTSFHLASTTKTFTAIAILRLVQEKKLSLDDSLTKFFPGLPYQGITVKMLLDHHSGLPNYLYFISNSDWDKNKKVYNQDVLDQLYALQPMADFPAGTRFSYSNTNFVLLALITEKITGRSFPEYMRSKFFIPLKMDHSFVFTDADSATATPSFYYNNKFWENDFLDMTYGDKNIYSTPRDMLKWDQALYSGQLIKKDLQDSAFTPTIISSRDSLPRKHNYGLGFRLMLSPGGKKVIYHFGRWHGFNAAFSRLTDEQVTIIILGNRFNKMIYNAAYFAYNIFGSYTPGNIPVEEEIESIVSVKKGSSLKIKGAKSHQNSSNSKSRK
jgi:CubicO group peptidase (beta-lactamase class C family)